MLDVVEEDFEEDGAKGLLYFMCGRLNILTGGSLYMLLLKKVEGQTGTFERIGLVLAWNNEIKERMLLRDPEEAQLPCLRYQDGLHSIHMI